MRSRVRSNRLGRMIGRDAASLHRRRRSSATSSREPAAPAVARLDDPGKRWKLRKGDLDDRKLWKDYTEAYEDVLSRTSTDEAPWYVVPTNKKWYRNLVVATVLVDVLEKLDMRYPEPEEDLDGIVIE